MNSLSLLWERVVRALEILTLSLFAVLVLSVLWGVISRYMPGIRPSDWTEEIAIYLLMWISLLGAALTYRHYGHLGVDYFVGKLDPAAQKWVAVLVELATLSFALFALVYGGGRLVSETLSTNQLTPFLQLKVGYLYGAVPISGIFMVCFAIEHLLKLNVAAATQSQKEG
jgi:TRAP-type C4-dicarboxylate transport system permease small subunit